MTRDTANQPPFMAMIVPQTSHPIPDTRHPFVWPEGRPFALFLSHDVDRIHDRELWRLLGDFGHVGRMIAGAEGGSLPLAFRRVVRALFNPKSALEDFETILEIEARHGFKSTFFLLHDYYWARYGARYRVTDRELHDIAKLVMSSDGEVGVHAGYYRCQNVSLLRESRQMIAEVAGTEPTGVRNHYLQFAGRKTWLAQEEAGFFYDATFGNARKVGPRERRISPFWAIEPNPGEKIGLVELPLSIMDVTLFDRLQRRGSEALEAAWSAIQPIVHVGGLVTLLWHNNYFNEPEYWDFQWVYERLLERLATLGPWCATGAEIASWWRAQT
ncbi:MAG: hypothetical protein JXA57_19015 [Armatimonadetes bacterium]|nr:hypothetical protein [Armatimonadota bacterium]